MINNNEIKELINAIEFAADQETFNDDEDGDSIYDSYCLYCGNSGIKFKNIEHDEDCIIHLVKKIKKELKRK